MAKKHYNVSYQYSESVFCSNVAHAESIEAVEEYYSGYSWCNISECDEWELEAALRRGTPIVEVEAVLPEEAEPETADANQSAEYNYCEAMEEDIENWIEENLAELSEQEFECGDDMADWLNDRLWAEDSVTGNSSGSYWCSRYRAEEALAHNWGLLEEALGEFGVEENPIEKGPEWCDVTIRCYLLSEAISNVVCDLCGPRFGFPLF